MRNEIPKIAAIGSRSKRSPSISLPEKIGGGGYYATRAQ
jgi:hypothetical protein